ncbi:lymphotoxin-beta isoform X3 [Cavia porcellus]|uniref:lymphotoxin-beta isoform X3 n=1 Tax=Cavia porcellus TaxID=10141 RepID=UPI00022B78A8|nr:lymphotoxin-beta isoform X2 [Cavia porcellus]
MGDLGLQGRDRRPRGRGCLLLAVAGATALVTLLLAVPVTVLAVLALVPQEQGGPVTETPGPGAQAQRGLGFQERQEEAPDADSSPVLPAAHLIGAWTQGRGLGWEAHKEEAFLRSGAQFSGARGLALPRDGLYFLYCHVGFRGRALPAGPPGPGLPLTLRSALLRAGGAYGPGAAEPLLEGAETVRPAAGRAAAPLWFTSVGFGGLVRLRRGERVYVNISHPDLVDYRRGKTFFGAVMLG